MKFKIDFVGTRKGLIKSLEKHIKELEEEETQDKVGTGIFNFNGVCNDCKNKTLIDINGFCECCYIEDLEREIKEFIK